MNLTITPIKFNNLKITPFKSQRRDSNVNQQKLESNYLTALALKNQILFKGKHEKRALI